MFVSLFSFHLINIRICFQRASYSAKIARQKLKELVNHTKFPP